MKSKILIVVTFFHRRFTLNGLEAYYKDKDVDILFVDQSYYQIIKQTSLRNVIDVLHYPADKVNFYEMWIDLVKKYGAEYDYFVWNNDDDFTIAESVNEIQDFLNTDEGKNYSLVTGQVMQINMDLAHNKHYATTESLKKDITDSSGSERLLSAFTKNNGIHVNPHAVIKASVFDETCRAIIKTKNTDHSLMPIRFFDKILTAAACIAGYRKTNFENVTSIRTERNFTGSLMDRPDFPRCLQKDISYGELVARLKKKNVFAKEFSIEESVVYKCFDPRNLECSSIKYTTLQSDLEKQISRIKEVYTAICAESDKDFIKERIDILGYAVIHTSLGKNVLQECLKHCKDTTYPRGKSFKASAEVSKNVFSQETKDVYANKMVQEIFSSYGVKLQDVFITHEYKQDTARNNYLHFDRLRSYKILTYLTDVTDADGPFSLVRGSHTFGRDARRSFQNQPNYEEKKNRIDIDYPGITYELEPILGPAGTTIIFDSDVFHLGGKVNENHERVIIRSHWYADDEWRETS
tara:strand:- start:3796 stop:5361 length:1566 start_codon:yes stop_codon:yes gene_type:complete